jgi:hypothetical protein
MTARHLDTPASLAQVGVLCSAAAEHTIFTTQYTAPLPILTALLGDTDLDEAVLASAGPVPLRTEREHHGTAALRDVASPRRGSANHGEPVTTLVVLTLSTSTNGHAHPHGQL